MVNFSLEATKIYFQLAYWYIPVNQQQHVTFDAFNVVDRGESKWFSLRGR